MGHNVQFQHIFIILKLLVRKSTEKAQKKGSREKGVKREKGVRSWRKRGHGEKGVRSCNTT